ncbi:MULTISPECIES: NF045616 family extracytoplasmic (lipo)protein [unclassified Acinetobacter]|uniref:NF045616 family extracytoplasmic (lipo)protein n=1 Tax=unclassified Acinetobacter TaxID=196816 RepID=UPI00190AC5DA|nr:MULTISPECIES: NF045616 family extracytoplasmic (lipo)protein [unclassified Acinetobacter]MBK0064323.1 glycosyltransferase [Acinetobacter sp. S55]MBK0067685.1 glycosyltransferase [Acinetobacter sp. S54]
MNKKLLVLILVSILFQLIACAQPINNQLNIISNNDLCIYTGRKTGYSTQDDYFIVFVGEYNPQESFKSIYEKKYNSLKFPTNKKSCINVPSEIFEKSGIYSINLESNKNYSQLVCVKKDKRNSILYYRIKENLICSDEEIKLEEPDGVMNKIKSVLKFN